jgi:hypothetical protein
VKARFNLLNTKRTSTSLVQKIEQQSAADKVIVLQVYI